MIGWDSDVACWSGGVSFDQVQGNAAFAVHRSDDEGGGFIEFVFELSPAAIGPAGSVGCIHMFKDDSFLALTFDL